MYPFPSDRATVYQPVPRLKFRSVCQCQFSRQNFSKRRGTVMWHCRLAYCMGTWCVAGRGTNVAGALPRIFQFGPCLAGCNAQEVLEKFNTMFIYIFKVGGSDDRNSNRDGLDKGREIKVSFVGCSGNLGLSKGGSESNCYSLIDCQYPLLICYAFQRSAAESQQKFNHSQSSTNNLPPYM